ncbi:hypothetical protein [Streptomyces ehimensis]|uniref:Uncharacterized protein n=1 Tax=Streptomyces ehimensis TaxID=68195 RepID=A0ABV9BWK4_9ACTN
MTKEIVTVCLPASPFGGWEEALKAAMEPFDMNRADPPGEGRPNGEWDWYHVYGGDGEIGLPVRPGHESDPRIVHNPVFSNGQPRAHRTMHCDGGPRRLLDFETVRSVKAAEAGRRWDAMSRFAAPYAPARPFGHFRRKFQENPEDYPWTQARADYLEQPLLQALTQAPPDSPILQERGGAADCIGTTRDEYVRREVSGVIPTNMLLTLDGVWIDGTLDPVHHPDLPRGEHYLLFADEYLMSLDGDTFVIRVRFHS